MNKDTLQTTADNLEPQPVKSELQVKAKAPAPEAAQPELETGAAVEPSARLAELARAQQDRRRGSLNVAQDAVESAFTTKAEIFRIEMEALHAEEQRTLANRDQPLRERMAEVDYIRERMVKVEQEITEHEKAATRRLAESAHLLAELEGRGIVADLREEVERQKEALATLPKRVQQAVEAKLATMPKPKSGGLGLVPTLVALVLIAAVGVAGVLLPRGSGSETQSEANTRALVETATLYQASGKTEDALRLLDDAVAAGLSDAETLGRVGEMYRVLGQPKKAIELLKQAVKQDPKNEKYLLSLARSYGSNGQHNEAIEQYQGLLKIKPNTVAYYAEMGSRYRSLKNYDMALSQFQKTLEINPKYWQGYYYQGEIYRDQQKYDEAIAQYQKGLEISPYYLSWVYAGQSYAGKNDYAKAIEQYQAAIDNSPDRAEAYFYTGEVYLAQGHFDQAVGPYQQAIAKNEKYTAAYVGLGKAYVALNDCAKATEQFTAALKLDPKNALAQEGMAACPKK